VLATTGYFIRCAQIADVAALGTLIAASARALQAPFYTSAQIEAALGPVFAVDEQLILDQTYFVAEQERAIIACGGWSKRETLFGGRQGHVSVRDRVLDPNVDAARIRAFFVHPSRARRGIGTALLLACEADAAAAGYSKLELVATLSGEPLYATRSFHAVARTSIPLGGGLSMQVVRMRKSITPRRDGDAGRVR
jgi:N-acetylglutamate synthase-like GNAT family acetyltransferase